jgi:hypothetical protein
MLTGLGVDLLTTSGGLTQQDVTSQRPLHQNWAPGSWPGCCAPQAFWTRQVQKSWGPMAILGWKQMAYVHWPCGPAQVWLTWDIHVEVPRASKCALKGASILEVAGGQKAREPASTSSWTRGPSPVGEGREPVRLSAEIKRSKLLAGQRTAWNLPLQTFLWLQRSRGSGFLQTGKKTPEWPFIRLHPGGTVMSMVWPAWLTGASVSCLRRWGQRVAGPQVFAWGLGRSSLQPGRPQPGRGLRPRMLPRKRVQVGA